MADHAEELDDEFEVHLAEDTEDADHEASAPTEDEDEELAPEPDEAEVASYSHKVKKRIDKLSFEKHEARRKADALAKERDEAIRIVQHLQAQVQQTKATLGQFESGFMEQGKARTESELLQAKAEMKAAFEAGDADKMADAQEKIARLAPQHEQFSRYRPQPVEEQRQVQAPQPQAPTHNPDADARTVEWLSSNPWFNTDAAMKGKALEFHEQVATTFPHLVGTEQYFKYIDGQMRQAMPDKFGAGAERKPRASAVTPANRAATSGQKAKRTVTLTESQVRLAQRLGLSPKQYAEQLLAEGGQ